METVGLLYSQLFLYATSHMKMQIIERKYIMDDGYLKGVSILLQEMERFMRYNAAKADCEMLQEIAQAEYTELIKMGDARLDIITDEVKKIVELLNTYGADTMVNIQEAHSKLKHIYDQESEKVKKMEQVFHTDIEEMKLREQRINALQDLVNIDMQQYGKVAQVTREILEVQHMMLTKEMRVAEVDREEGSSVGISEINAPEQPKEEQKEHSFQACVYTQNVKGKKQKPKIIYGNSAEDIIATLQGWNQGRTDDMKFRTCYVRKLNTKTNQYENPAKYDVITGADLTPIYLNLPHMEKSKYLKLVDELKKNGACYNYVEKAFYVTRQNDLNKFAEYLPIQGSQAEGENRSKNQLGYEITAGKEYYDNRIRIDIDGMKPLQIYGDDYGVHFPSMGVKEIREFSEKFILPFAHLEKERNQQEEAKIIYNQKEYTPLQYRVIEYALQHNFTPEQLALLERPELTADRLNEIRFAICDGLSAEQISKFATTGHEQWQMDLCRIGMQNGISYEELSELINPKNNLGSWHERRGMLARIIKGKSPDERHSMKAYEPHIDSYKGQGDRNSVLDKLNQNKATTDVKREPQKDGKGVHERVEVK